MTLRFTKIAPENWCCCYVIDIQFVEFTILKQWDN